MTDVALNVRSGSCLPSCFQIDCLHRLEALSKHCSASYPVFYFLSSNRKILVRSHVWMSAVLFVLHDIISREARILQITSLLDHVHNNNTDVTPLSDTSKGFS
jgi:hypothetical protein